MTAIHSAGGADDDIIPFTCNICGARCAALRRDLERERPTCGSCGSTVRFRSLVSALTTWSHGRSRTLPEIRRTRRSGLGLSDWPALADALTRVYSYTNTFLDEEPRLDIVHPPAELIRGTDFLISSDVFEHVAPPVQRAFDGAFALLRPGGLLVLSVPYIPDQRTVEHYPQLDDFAIVQLRAGHVLVNRATDGRLEVFDGLVFHGGPGSTLEMRLFGLPDILDALDAAGFVDVAIAAEDPAHGVIWQDDFSRTLVARVPGQPGLWRRLRRTGPS